MKYPGTKCNQCERVVELREDNTVLFVYPAQPWLCYVQFMCDECDGEGRQFLGDFIEEVLEHCNKHDYPTIVEEWPSDTLIENFAEVYGVQLLKENPLTDKEETLVKFFHYLLERWDGDVRCL